MSAFPYLQVNSRNRVTTTDWEGVKPYTDVQKQAMSPTARDVVAGLQTVADIPSLGELDRITRLEIKTEDICPGTNTMQGLVTLFGKNLLSLRIHGNRHISTTFWSKASCYCKDLTALELHGCAPLAIVTGNPKEAAPAGMDWKVREPHRCLRLRHLLSSGVRPKTLLG